VLDEEAFTEFLDDRGIEWPPTE